MMKKKPDVISTWSSMNDRKMEGVDERKRVFGLSMRVHLQRKYLMNLPERDFTEQIEDTQEGKVII